MTKKLLHILSGDLWGGAEAQMGMQLPEVAKLGWEVRVLLFNEEKTAEMYRSAGLSLEIVLESTGFFSLLRMSLASAKKFQPSVIVAHGYKESILAFYLSRKLGCPWVVWFHGLSEGYTGITAFKNQSFQVLQMQLAKSSAARLITVSKNAAQRLGISSLRKTRVIYNAAGLQSAVDRPELARYAIVIVGRLVPIKRVDRAIAAFIEACRLSRRDSLSQVRQLHLYIIGDGPLEQQLRQQVATCGEESAVHFLGFRSDAAVHIAAADMLLMTSDSEGLPTVLLEALAAQRPVVSTAVGGIPEVLDLFPEYPARLVDLHRPEVVSDLAIAISEIVEFLEQETTKGLNDLNAASETRKVREDWQAQYQKLFSPAVAAEQQVLELKAILGLA